MLGAAVLGAMTMPFARAANPWQPATLHQARQLDITSPITGQTYPIFVSIPTTPPTPADYPVIYALDGNATFPTLALMARTIMP